jgi:hypothetical protein
MRSLGRFEERRCFGCVAKAICAAVYLEQRRRFHEPPTGGRLCYWRKQRHAVVSTGGGWRGSLDRAFGHGMPCPYCGKKNDFALGAWLVLLEGGLVCAEEPIF